MVQPLDPAVARLPRRPAFPHILGIDELMVDAAIDELPGQRRPRAQDMGGDRVADLGLAAHEVEGEAPVRHGEAQRGPRLQHAVQLVEPGDQVRHVLDHVRGDGVVEIKLVAERLGDGPVAPDRIDLRDVGADHVRVVGIFVAQVGRIGVVHVFDVALRLQDQRMVQRPDLDPPIPGEIQPRQQLVPTIHAASPSDRPVSAALRRGLARVLGGDRYA